MSYYSNLILASNPDAYWRLGELSGTAAADSTGHGYTGTYLSGCSLGYPGAIKNDPDTSVLFDGTLTGAVNLGVVPSVISDFTWEFWIKPTTPVFSFAKIMCQGGYGFPGAFMQLDGARNGDYGTLFWGTGSYTLPTDPGQTPPNQWTHVGTTRVSGVLTVYVNGVIKAQATGITNEASSVPLSIGSNVYHPSDNEPGYPGLTGAMDEVATYSSGLSGQVLLSHYLAGIHGPPKRGGGFNSWWANGDE